MIQQIFFNSKIIFLFFLFAGCLRTHDQILEEKGDLTYKKKQPPNRVEKKKGDHSFNKELAKIKERIDLLERNSVNKQEVDSIEESLRKNITKLEDQVSSLSSTVSKNNSSTKKKKSPPSSLFDQAENYFKNKDYKTAILTYEEFRKTHPADEKFKIATMKIGLSFMNLDLKQEAESFFKEVIEKFPDSEEAKQAMSLLK